MRYAILVISLAILSMLVFEFNSRTAGLNRLTEKKEAIIADLESRRGTLTALEAQIVVASSDSAVIRWAHEDGHMIREGEYAVVPIQAYERTPEPTQQPVVTQIEVSNIDSWLTLLVEQQSP